MKRISEVVAEAKRIARATGRSYPYAAKVALSSLGYPSNTHETQTVRQTYIINDEHVDEKSTLFQAVVKVLGRDGGNQAAISTEKRRQMQIPAV